MHGYLFVPLFIFFARILDVTIGTIRIIMIARGNRVLSALLGFFEVTIWLLAISQVLANLTNIVSYIAYGGGFAAGNFIGISLERRLAIGMQAIHVVTKENLKILSMLLREKGFGVTNMKATGQKGKLDFIYIVAPRKEAQQVVKLVKEFDPESFISIADLRSTSAGYFGSITPGNSWLKRLYKRK